MDNIKTGALIRERRKKKGLTQRELAERLHVTDRAVSKWERGLCAPDIALLEPLSEALDLSVLELISGERVRTEEPEAKAEAAARSAIAYSRAELMRKLRALRLRHVALAAAALAVLALIAFAALWRNGLPFILDRSPAPEGGSVATVYSKALSGGGFSAKDAVSLIVERENGSKLRITYGDCEYAGLWWAPDGSKYVLALDGYGGGYYLALAWLENNHESNLNAHLHLASAPTGAEVEYRFLQWGRDSETMLLYYSYVDTVGARRDGYFWYNCVSGETDAVLELDAK